LAADFETQTGTKFGLTLTRETAGICHFYEDKKCDGFGQAFGDQAKIAKARAPGGKGKVFCPDCGKPILLRDVVEENQDRQIRETRETETVCAGSSAIERLKCSRGSALSALASLAFFAVRTAGFEMSFDLPAAAGAGVAAGLVQGVNGRRGFIRVHPRLSVVELLPPLQGLGM